LITLPDARHERADRIDHRGLMRLKRLAAHLHRLSGY
jgi:hypothetical protein